MDILKAAQVVGAYKRALNTPEGEVLLKDLSVKVGMIPDPDQMEKENALSHYAGEHLTHPECAYRNGQQDLVRYIEAMLA